MGLFSFARVIKEMLIILNNNAYNNIWSFINKFYGLDRKWSNVYNKFNLNNVKKRNFSLSF